MTNKISVSIPDTALLEWMQARADRQGKSLSAVIVAAIRFEHQLELRREFLASWPARRTLTPEDRAAIRAEWEGGPRYEPTNATGAPRKTKQPKTSRVAPKKRRAA